MINLDNFKVQNAKAVSSINRAKVVTLDEARQKIADKLDANLQYFKGNTTDEIDAVYYKQNDKYADGAKYGNRWLQGLFGEKLHYVTVSKDELEYALSGIKECVLAGQADEIIKNIMENNKRKKAA